MFEEYDFFPFLQRLDRHIGASLFLQHDMPLALHSFPYCIRNRSTDDMQYERLSVGTRTILLWTVGFLMDCSATILDSGILLFSFAPTMATRSAANTMRPLINFIVFSFQRPRARDRPENNGLSLVHVSQCLTPLPSAAELAAIASPKAFLASMPEHSVKHVAPGEASV